MTQRMALAILLILVLAGYGLYKYKVKSHTDITNPAISTSAPVDSVSSSCTYQDARIVSQSQNGNACSVTLSDGKVLFLDCLNMANHPVGSTITESTCK